MSSHESQHDVAQSFVSKAWNYDDGKARWRAFAFAVVTLVVVAPLIFCHWSRFDQSAYEHRFPGYPFYVPDTVILGGCVAVFANAITGFVATRPVIDRFRQSAFYGTVCAALSPGIVLLVRDLRTIWNPRCCNVLDYHHHNSINQLTTYLWLPLVAGTIIGASLARLRRHLAQRPREVRNDGATAGDVMAGCSIVMLNLALLTLSGGLLLRIAHFVLGK